MVKATKNFSSGKFLIKSFNLPIFFTQFFSRKLKEEESQFDKLQSSLAKRIGKNCSVEERKTKLAYVGPDNRHVPGKHGGNWRTGGGSARSHRNQLGVKNGVRDYSFATFKNGEKRSNLMQKILKEKRQVMNFNRDKTNLIKAKKIQNSNVNLF